MPSKILYLSQGKLFAVNDGKEEQIESAFGQDILRRSLERNKKNEWKTEGQTNLFGRSQLWGVAQEDPTRLKLNITAVCRGANAGQIAYILETESVGGLFLYDCAEKKETRVFHREGVSISHLDRQKDTGAIVCSQAQKSGTASISLCDGSHLEAITEGDSRDESPSWIPGKEKEIVFQSAGIARNEAGMMTGIGPYSIQRLSLATGNMETLLEDAKFDFLQPRMDSEGNLYCIKRPYESFGRKAYPFVEMLKDVFLFPFRLGRAVFHYLNFFSLIYSKKPLTTAGGPKLEGLDAKNVMLQGRILDAEKILREGVKDGEAPNLVPADWQLIKLSPDGKQSVVRNNVAAFDLSADGKVVISTGAAICELNGDGGTNILSKGKLCGAVFCLG